MTEDTKEEEKVEEVETVQPKKTFKEKLKKVILYTQIAAVVVNFAALAYFKFQPHELTNTEVATAKAICDKDGRGGIHSVDARSPKTVVCVARSEKSSWCLNNHHMNVNSRSECVHIDEVNKNRKEENREVKDTTQKEDS
jgi:hypothetical protein